MKTLQTTKTVHISLGETGELTPGSRDPALRFGRAREALRRGDYTEAAYESLAAVTLRPFLPEAHYLAGVALLRLGLVDEAEQSLLEVVAQKADHAGAHLALAHIYGRLRLDFFRLGKHRHLAAMAARGQRDDDGGDEIFAA